MKKRIYLSFLSVLFLFIFTGSLEAQVKLPRLIRDSMILQRDQPIRIWGWAAPGEKVKVGFNKKRFTAITARDGQWLLRLPAMPAGGPYTMTIDASNHVSIKEILIGDVWLCSGQSNMVHQMALHNVRYESDIAQANNPQIRHFWVPNTTNLRGPQEDLPGGYWKWANPDNIGEFSAVAYFFARKINEQYHVPIGLINASWGGTPIEAWLSEEAFQSFPALLPAIQQNKDTAYVFGNNRKAAAASVRANTGPDKGLEEGWYKNEYVPRGWQTLNIPGYWDEQGIRDLDGVVWYRREIEVPASMVNVPAKVFLGRIVDADVLYINGQQVGITHYMYPQRRYAVPDGVLHAGKNLFTIRVTNNAGKGGFVPDKPYQLIAGKDTIDLKGSWDYKVGQVFLPMKHMGAPMNIAVQNQPTALYNAMIAPLINYTVKGVIWYQGETNAGRPAEYAQYQPALIAEWRKRFRDSTLPFLYVQLPGYMDRNYLPAESGWAAFREAQSASLRVPHTGMAVAIDLGEWNDVHPDRKQEVGERLALAAGHVAYGDDKTEYSGPLFEAARTEGNKIILSFTHTGSGLVSKDGGALSEFAIAGSNKQFVWAKARITGNQVEVWSEDIAEPKYVRYAWADNPVNPNLFNKEGLPASPFRTDKP